MSSALIFLAALVAAVSAAPPPPFFMANSPLAPLRSIAPAFPLANSLLLRANAVPVASPIYPVNPAFAPAAPAPIFSDSANEAAALFLEDVDPAVFPAVTPAAGAQFLSASATPAVFANSAAARNLYDASATLTPATALYTMAPHTAARRLNALRAAAFSPSPAVYAVSPQSNSVAFFDAPADVPMSAAFPVPLQSANAHLIQPASVAYASAPAVRSFLPFEGAASLSRAHSPSSAVFSPTPISPAASPFPSFRAVMFNSPASTPEFLNAAAPLVSAPNSAVLSPQPAFHTHFRNVAPASHIAAFAPGPYSSDSSSSEIEAPTTFINASPTRPLFFDAAPAYSRVAPASYIASPIAATSAFAPAAAHLSAPRFIDSFAPFSATPTLVASLA